MKKVVKIAVRALIERMYRSGSLGVDFTSTERTTEGIAGHRKIQKTRPEGYRTEVPIVHQYETPYFILEISGRIDGVFETSEPITIEELKTTTLDPDDQADAENPVHWGQLKLYAYCYAKEHGLEQIAGQLTYYQLDTGAIRENRQLFTLNELTDFFQGVITCYLVWANATEEWYQLRDESIRNISFPFPEYRAGQRQIAVDVYLTVKQRGQLLIQAPTGIGKTMAVIFSAVKALGEGHVEKIFYLTARNTGQIAAEDALARLRQKGLRLKAVTIKAKEKACLAPEIYCQPEGCEYAQGYYDRIDQALKAAFELDELTSEAISELARRFKVCPFEFSLDLSLLADCIICDYNYAFDPRVYIKRFFRESTGVYTFLIDEAHNLVDRAREMFSAELSQHDIQELRKAVKPHLPKLYRLSGRINRWLNQARKQCKERGKSYADTTAPETLLPLLQKFNDEAEKWLVLNILAPFRKDLTDRYFEINRFLTVAEKFDECYTTCFDRSSGDLKVKLFCLDPSKQMHESLERSQAAVFFSATLTPIDYFQRLFGCQESARQRTLKSPFPPGNLCLLLMPKISTLYNNREATVPAVTLGILETVRQKQGNYLLFFPSYKYMQIVYEEFTAQQPDMDTIIQASAMTEEERDDFLARFSSDNRSTLVGFAVMGGIFGEGIDLVGDRLTGAVIVGVGLPAICLERELIRAYFDKSAGAGFEFAYMYPGLTRVLQAAGRVIRTETDQGVVVLIDERFSASRYRTLFPKEWRPVNITSADKLHETLQEFWGEERN
jgi:DNA excision repair protein ERCC-2